MAFTKKQVKKFKENGGKCCPKCQSENIEMTYSDYNDNEYWTQNRCWDCEGFWKETYKLEIVEEMDVEGNII